MHVIRRSCIVITVLVTPLAAWAGQPSREAIAAWNAVIARAEAEIDARGRTAPSFDRHLVLTGGTDIAELSTIDERGEEVSIPGATLQRWRGAMLVPGTTVDAVVRSLEQRPPEQPDVSASRILWRANGQMAVYLRLVRRMLVTVTYDTEHTVTFYRLTPARAFSRSVMTRVREVSNAGTSEERFKTAQEERGFLWKLNAYWWYEDTPRGVIVVMESLTLSRDIPAVVRPLASPLVRRIAGESVMGALSGVRGRFDSTPLR
jgi:hypothetical protein